MKKAEIKIALDELKMEYSPDASRMLKQDSLSDAEQLELIKHLKYLNAYNPESKIALAIRKKLGV